MTTHSHNQDEGLPGGGGNASGLNSQVIPDVEGSKHPKNEPCAPAKGLGIPLTQAGSPARPTAAIADASIVVVSQTTDEGNGDPDADAKCFTQTVWQGAPGPETANRLAQDSSTALPTAVIASASPPGPETANRLAQDSSTALPTAVIASASEDAIQAATADIVDALWISPAENEYFTQMLANFTGELVVGSELPLKSTGDISSGSAVPSVVVQGDLEEDPVLHVHTDP
eukprot:CAMPEP_0206150098 /NCGR_PEP_ID=MMETSP1473-20131121/38125_1 /ASSEMBLY_ACC=CAM_ASM_001109 /TAXON_ID=1461547 /ORGANISM="Stichococcus sp, Strain RCC1054" /LENGTH=228 /DNA_ID=CAMNT_0053547587 /DNA_START=181 /DNA_END=868 /DNA_ORIENTATION=-